MCVSQNGSATLKTFHNKFLKETFLLISEESEAFGKLSLNFILSLVEGYSMYRLHILNSAFRSKMCYVSLLELLLYSKGKKSVLFCPSERKLSLSWFTQSQKVVRPFAKTSSYTLTSPVVFLFNMHFHINYLPLSEEPNTAIRFGEVTMGLFSHR